MKLMLSALLLALALQPALVSARAQAEESPPPVDERETWRIGVTPLESVGLTPEQQLLTRSVPLMLLETLSGLREHRLSESERNARRRIVRDTALREAGRRLDGELRARDRLLFADITPETREQRLEQAEARVDEARKEYQRLAEMQPARIEMATRKPLEVYPGAAELLPAGISPREIARQERLDWVFSGSIKPLDDEYLVLEVSGYSAAEDRTLFRDTEVVRHEELYELVEGVIDRAAEAALGRPWANLTVHSSQPDAAVLVDGMLYGFGSVTVNYLEPGPREVGVTYENREISRTIVLLPFERAELQLDFPAVESAAIVIESEPAGADVYVESVWTGRTPTTVTRPAQPVTALLQREGYHSSRVVLSPDSPAVVSRRLTSDIVGWGEQTLEQRDRFYRSLGFFVLSLPAPIILSGVYNNLYTFSVEATQPVDPARLETVLWAYRGSVGLSVGLFVNVAVQLVRYIRTAESYHFH